MIEKMTNSRPRTNAPIAAMKKLMKTVGILNTMYGMIIELPNIIAIIPIEMPVRLLMAEGGGFLSLRTGTLPVMTICQRVDFSAISLYNPLSRVARITDPKVLVSAATSRTNKKRNMGVSPRYPLKSELIYQIVIPKKLNAPNIVPTPMKRKPFIRALKYILREAIDASPRNKVIRKPPIKRKSLITIETPYS